MIPSTFCFTDRLQKLQSDNVSRKILNTIAMQINLSDNFSTSSLRETLTQASEAFSGKQEENERAAQAAEEGCTEDLKQLNEQVHANDHREAVLNTLLAAIRLHGKALQQQLALSQENHARFQSLSEASDKTFNAWVEFAEYTTTRFDNNRSLIASLVEALKSKVNGAAFMEIVNSTKAILENSDDVFGTKPLLTNMIQMMRKSKMTEDKTSDSDSTTWSPNSTIK